MANVTKVKLTVSWLRQVSNWLSRAHMLGIALVPLAASLAYLWHERWTEPHVRWNGLGLQLAGVLSVAFGVASTRKQFGHPSMSDRTLAFLRDRPRYACPISGMAASLQANATMTATGFVTVGVAPEQTIDARLFALEQRLNELGTKVANDTAEIRGELRGQTALLYAESTSRSEADAPLHRQLEMTATGGLDLSLCGVAWLIVGSVCSTIPIEISRLF